MPYLKKKTGWGSPICITNTITKLERKNKAKVKWHTGEPAKNIPLIMGASRKIREENKPTELQNMKMNNLVKVTGEVTEDCKAKNIKEFVEI